MFLRLGSAVIPKKSAGLKQCPRAVVLICSQNTSSWIIDSLLACFTCACYLTHISPFPSEPLTSYINAEYQNKQAEAQSALVTQAEEQTMNKGMLVCFLLLLEHWHSWTNTSANKGSFGMPIQWLSKICWLCSWLCRRTAEASPPRCWKRAIYQQPLTPFFNQCLKIRRGNSACPLWAQDPQNRLTIPGQC